ncbi:MAG: hypothetical protein V4605_08050 [Pseudomonadota bacterium]
MSSVSTLIKRDAVFKMKVITSKNIGINANTAPTELYWPDELT